MRRWILRILLLAAVVALAVGARWWFLAPKAVAVTAAPAALGTVEATITNTRAGTVKAHRRTRLSPESGGMAVAIPYDEGEQVKKGEVVLELDSSVQRAALALGQREVDAADARRNQACVQAELAHRELARFRKLHQDRIVAEDVLDQSQSASDAADAACAAAAADVERARASVRMAQVELDKTVLRAPFDGVVAQISIELGEWTSPSPPALPIPPVIDLIDQTSIYVSAPMDEVDAAKLTAGLRGRVTVDSHRGHEFWGTVVRVSPYVLDLEAQNRTVEIDVELDDQTLSATLRPGTSADVEVVLETRENTLRVPTSSLYEGDQVMVVEGERLASRKVEVGLKNWNWTEVRGGLEPGELIVTTLDRPEIKPGALVDVELVRASDDGGDEGAPTAP